MSAYGTVKLGPNDYLWSCSICSALVVNRSKHDQWHTAPAANRLDWLRRKHGVSKNGEVDTLEKP